MNGGLGRKRGRDTYSGEPESYREGPRKLREWWSNRIKACAAVHGLTRVISRNVFRKCYKLEMSKEDHLLYMPGYSEWYVCQICKMYSVFFPKYKTDIERFLQYLKMCDSSLPMKIGR